ncbi:Fc.00g115910.m01.CDS01 [Cosmosporella sp. VM-42]
MFYSRRSLALRIAHFFPTAPIFRIAGGLIAYSINFMDHYGGWRAWRWIIVITGPPTLFTGIIIPVVLPNSPETAKLLTDEDKHNLRLVQEGHLGKAKNLRKLVKEDAMDSAKDWTTQVQAITVRIYVVDAITYLVCARASGLLQRRGYFVMGGIVSAVVGYGMLIASKGRDVSYAGCCLVSIGIFV